MNRQPLSGRSVLALATIATLLCAAGCSSSSSGSAPARSRSVAVLSRALAPSKRSAHAVLLSARVTSSYRPCQANRTVRFYHRAGGRDLFLGLSIGPGLKGYSRRRHRTSPQGRVATIAKVTRPRTGAYYMTVLPKTLPDGATCLGAKSNLRRAR